MRDESLHAKEAVELRADPWRYWIFPQYEAWLTNKGYLSSGGCLPTEARRVFNASPRRENAWRDDGPMRDRVFDKSVKDIRARDLLASAALHGGVRAPSPPVHEFRMLCHARAHGVRVPRPMACGERRRGPIPREGFLVMEALAGDSLLELLTAEPFAMESALPDIAREVGMAVAQLHMSHLSFPSLFSKHVYYDPEATPTVGFLDLADARHHRSVPNLKTRSRDWAALCVTLPRFDVRRTLRIRALRSYLATLGEDPRTWRELWIQIASHGELLASRKRHRLFASPEPVRLPAILQGSDGSEIRREVAPLLAQIGSHADIVRGAVEDLPDFSIVRGSRKSAMKHWRTLFMLRQFGVPIPEPMALLLKDQEAALLLAKQPQAASVLPHAKSLTQLFMRILDAGCFPQAPLLPHVMTDASGAVHLSFDAVRPMKRPARILRLHRRRALSALRQEIARAPYPEALRSEVLARLAEFEATGSHRIPSIRDDDD